MKCISILIVSILLLSSCSSSSNNDDAITIHVESIDTTAQLVKVYRIEHGGLTLMAENDFKGEEGVYTFTDTLPSNAFYVLFNERKQVKVYARKGQEVSTVIKEGEFEIRKASKENKILESWYALSKEARRLSIKHGNDREAVEELAKLTPYYDAQRVLEKESIAFLEEVEKKCKDPFLKSALPELVNAEINYLKLFFRQIPAIKATIKEDPEDLYKTIIVPDRFNSAMLLDIFESTVEYVQLYGAWCQYKAHVNAKPSLTYIANPDIKVAYLLRFARSSKNGRWLKTIEENYLDLFQSGYALEELNKIRASFDALGDPKTLDGIELKTAEGKLVKLSDYIGNILVVDVWATWCGPCIKKRPAFEKLAEEMKGEEVTFIALSVDQSERKWEQMVKGKKKTAVFDMIDPHGTFSKTYGIAAIPHFLIFDATGKLVDSPAPYPGGEDCKLKKRIIELLSEDAEGKV